MDPISGRNRGYCFVTFTEKKAAEEAVKQVAVCDFLHIIGKALPWMLWHHLFDGGKGVWSVKILSDGGIPMVEIWLELCTCESSALYDHHYLLHFMH